MSDPLANARHRRNAARWRAHPFARASDALEAKIVEMKARHLRAAAEVSAEMVQAFNRDGYDINAHVFLDARTLRACFGTPAGHMAVMRKAIQDLAGAIGGKLADQAGAGVGTAFGSLDTRSPL